MERGEYRATIYDDVWRTIVHDFPNLLVAFVNELFGESYSKAARVEFLQDTHEQKMPVVLCQDLVQHKMRNFNYFQLTNSDSLATLAL